MANQIHFFTEDIDFVLPQKIKTRIWLKSLVAFHGMRAKEINFVFCSDAYLLNINQQFLNHDTFTDIVTFDHSEKVGNIKSDVFISWERVRENAQKFNVNNVDELHRVMAHGLLHLLGFKDKTKRDKDLMTEMENKALQLRNF